MFSVSWKRANDPHLLIAAADSIEVGRNSWKYDGVCMKGLLFVIF